MILYINKFVCGRFGKFTNGDFYFLGKVLLDVKELRGQVEILRSTCYSILRSMEADQRVVKGLLRSFEGPKIYPDRYVVSNFHGYAISLVILSTGRSL